MSSSAQTILDKFATLCSIYAFYEMSIYQGSLLFLRLLEFRGCHTGLSNLEPEIFIVQNQGNLKFPALFPVTSYPHPSWLMIKIIINSVKMREISKFLIDAWFWTMLISVFYLRDICIKSILKQNTRCFDPIWWQLSFRFFFQILPQLHNIR